MNVDFHVETSIKHPKPSSHPWRGSARRICLYVCLCHAMIYEFVFQLLFSPHLSVHQYQYAYTSTPQIHCYYWREVAHWFTCHCLPHSVTPEINGKWVCSRLSENPLTRSVKANIQRQSVFCTSRRAASLICVRRLAQLFKWVLRGRGMMSDSSISVAISEVTLIRRVNMACHSDFLSRLKEIQLWKLIWYFKTYTVNYLIMHNLIMHNIS